LFSKIKFLHLHPRVHINHFQHCATYHPLYGSVENLSDASIIARSPHSAIQEWVHSTSAVFPNDQLYTISITVPFGTER
jgi:hypothetical protein